MAMPPLAPLEAPPGPEPWTWAPPAPARWEQPVQWFRLDGPDTRRFLHGQTSQALEGAPPGSWLRTCCIGPTARIKALAEVLLDADGAWLVITAGAAEGVRQALDRVLFPADAVTLGPLESGRLVQPFHPAGAPESAPADAPTGQWRRGPDGAGWWLGASLLLPSAAALPAPLAQLRALSAVEAERWRIQRGQPAAPQEINDDTNPFELGLADRVSLNKGCYVGQETLARLATYDGVKQQLRRWFLPAGSATVPPAPGQELRDSQGERAGRITSALALEDGGWIGLALVRRAWLEAPSLGLEGAAAPLWLSRPPELVVPPQGPAGRGAS